jgi:hypothetical protein
MGNANRLANDDLALLEMLTWKVRLVAEPQLAPAIKPNPIDLVRKGFLRSRIIQAKVIACRQPLATWRAGQAPPDFHALAWCLENRLRQARPSRCQVLWATPKCTRLLGGCGGSIRQPTQVEHDLALAGVFLARASIDPASWDAWLGEDVWRQQLTRREKVPDAVLVNDHGKATLAIEYGGAYSAERLRAFHRHCARQSLPYELW